MALPNRMEQLARQQALYQRAGVQVPEGLLARMYLKASTKPNAQGPAAYQALLKNPERKAPAATATVLGTPANQPITQHPTSTVFGMEGFTDAAHALPSTIAPEGNLDHPVGNTPTILPGFVPGSFDQPDAPTSPNNEMKTADAQRTVKPKEAHDNNDAEGQSPLVQALMAHGITNVHWALALAQRIEARKHRWDANDWGDEGPRHHDDKALAASIVAHVKAHPHASPDDIVKAMDKQPKDKPGKGILNAGIAPVINPRPTGPTHV